MHLELPKTPLQSLKDFLKHYLMIVLSILTALGLEAWIEHIHHKHAAEVASAQIEAEIRGNLEEVRKDLALDSHQEEVLSKMQDMLENDLKSNVPKAVMQQHIKDRASDFILDVRWPALRQEAWDMAVANQSASWIDEKRMYRFSAVYAEQRRSDLSIASNIQLINGPEILDAVVDVHTGNVEPVEFLHMVVQIETMQHTARNALSRLQQKLQDALSAQGSSQSKL
jgi:hypothetical protein